MATESFTCKLDKEGLEFFNTTCAKPFDQQACAFLNAYWDEVGDQADYIFYVAFEMIKYADMHAKGVEYIHLYDTGCELDFNIGLFFYEKLCKVHSDKDPKFKHITEDPKFARSAPEMLTAIVRKREIKEKVDVNFDNKITMLEYLLYQYRDCTNPADFVTRSLKAPDEHPEMKAARLALEDVNARIKAYETEKARLEALAEGTGVKALGAKNQLAQLESSPLKEELNKALIMAEASVRKAVKLFGSHKPGEDHESTLTDGSVWWMEKDLDEKKKRYAGKKK